MQEDQLIEWTNRGEEDKRSSFIKLNFEVENYLTTKY